jgi:hypothetical protein
MSNARELAQIPSTPSGRRNLIINGAMTVWQRGTSDDTASNNDFACDRWQIGFTGLEGNVDWDRSTDTPDDFSYSLKVSMDASETSLDAADRIHIQQKFEGQDVQHLRYGSSGAKTCTVSFWVKSSVAATYTLDIFQNEDVTSRVIGRSYTINAADTWEHKTITFVGDTAQAIENDNSEGLRLGWWLDAGSNFTSGTFSEDWQDYDITERIHSTTGWLESTSPEFYITGVQLEVGSVATEFEHRSFGEELALCQRYYHQQERTSSPIQGVYIGIGQVNQTTQAIAIYNLPVSMRTTPTLTHGTVGAGATSNYAGTLSAFYADNLHFSFYFVSTGMVVGDVIRIYNSNAGDKVTFDAEL